MLTQGHIDRILVLTTAVAIVAFSIFSLCRNSIVATLLEYEYLLEMIRRSIYLGGLFEWIGNADYITRNIEAGSSYFSNSPFSIILGNSDEESSIQVTTPFPYVIRYYNQHLEGFIQLKERFNREPKLSCNVEMNGAAVGFLCIGFLLMWALVKGSNLVAQRFPDRTGIKKGMIIIGLMLPILSGFSLHLYLISEQKNCVQRALLVYAKRSVTLVGSAFEAATLGLGADENLFSPTMEVLNANLAPGFKYCITSKYGEGAVPLAPPVPNISENVMTTLDAHQDNLLGDAIFFPEEDTILAAFPVSSTGMLIVLIHKIDDLSISYGSGALWCSLLLLMAPLVLIFAVDVFFFPYDVIGKVAPPIADAQTENFGPWAWRAAPSWPYFRALQLTLLVLLMVGAGYVFNDRLLDFLSNLSDYTVEFNERIPLFQEVYFVGDSHMKNMVDLISKFERYSPYLNLLDEFSGQSMVDIVVFYENFGFNLERVQYYGMSVAYLLSLEGEQQYPLLSNSDLAKLILEAESDETLDPNKVYLYNLYLLRFDQLQLRAILENDVVVLTSGDSVAKSYLVDNAADIKSTSDTVLGIVDGVLVSGSSFAEISSTYLQQPDETELQAFLQRPSSRAILELENEALTRLGTVSSVMRELNLDFMWFDSSFSFVCIAAIFIGGVTLIFDLLYTGAFFGLSDGKISARRTRRYLPSNDFTSPNPYLEVNHFALWTNAWWGYGIAAVVSLLLILVVVINLLEVQKTLNKLNDIHLSIDMLTQNSVKMVFESIPISSSVALWLRAFLSLAAEDVTFAIARTVLWAERVPVSYNGGPPEFEIDLDTTLVRSRLTSLASLSAVINRDQGTAKRGYDDFAYYVNLIDDFIDLEELIACGTPEPDKYFVENLLHAVTNMYIGMIQNNKDKIVAGFAVINSVIIQYGDTCGIEKDSLLYFDRLNALTTRVWAFQTKKKLAEEISDAESAGSQTLNESIGQVTAQYGELTIDSETLSIPWITIFSAWACVPFIFLMFVRTKNMHAALYNC